MNKAMKGTIAAAAALALLAGGAGTLAYWQQQESGASAQFGTGWMGMIANRDQQWTVNGQPVAADQLQNVRMVPGTTLVYTANERIESGGTDLYVAFDVDLGELTAFDGGDDHTAEVRDVLDVSSSLVAVQEDFGVVPTTTPGTYAITGTGDARLTITIEWPADSEERHNTMYNTVNLSNTQFTLRQVPNPLPTLELG